MKKFFICFTVLLIILVTACVPLSVSPADTMTFKLADNTSKEIYVINEDGYYLVRLGYKFGVVENDLTITTDQIIYKQGKYTPDAVREILTLMLPDINDNQYISDDLFAEFSNGMMRSDSECFGEVVYLSADQYEIICNSSLFKGSIVRYFDLKESEEYKMVGYHDLDPDRVENY